MLFFIKTSKKSENPKADFSKARREKTRKEFNESKHIEYKGIRNVKYLFDLSIDEEYYKPIITKGAFNNNYIQYESKGDKGEYLSIKTILI